MKKSSFNEIPSGYVNIAIENGPFEIVDFPIKKWIFPIKNGDFPWQTVK